MCPNNVSLAGLVCYNSDPLAMSDRDNKSAPQVQTEYSPEYRQSTLSCFGTYANPIVNLNHDSGSMRNPCVSQNGQRVEYAHRLATRTIEYMHAAKAKGARMCAMQSVPGFERMSTGTPDRKEE